MLNPTTAVNQLERLESDLATAEQDSRQKQARIERLERAVKELREAIKAELIWFEDADPAANGMRKALKNTEDA